MSGSVVGTGDIAEKEKKKKDTNVFPHGTYIIVERDRQ